MKKGLNTISSVYDKTTVIGKIYKGIVKIYESFRKLIAKGIPPITLPKCKGVNLVDYKIYGQSIQKSKNIFPTLETHQTAVGVTLSYDKSDNTFVLNGTSTSPKSFEIITVGQNYEEFRKGDSYTLSTYLVSGSTNTTQGPFIYIKDSYTNSNYVQRAVGGIAQTPYVFTYNGNGYINRIAISISETGHTYENYKFKIQLEKGRSATEFEPHLNPTPDTPVEVKSVGDKTQNLLNYKLAVPTSDTTVTFVDNGFHVVGSYGAIIKDIKVKPNTNYYLQFKRSNLVGERKLVTVYPNGTTSTAISYIRTDTGGTFNTGEYEEIQIYFYGGGNANRTGEATYTDIQLIEGTEATEYEPYGYRIPVRASGKNCLPYPYADTTKTTNGVTFTDNGDGSITVNGTPTTAYTAIFNLTRTNPFKDGVTYTVSPYADINAKVVINYKDDNGTTQTKSSVTWSDKYTFNRIIILVYKIQEHSNLVIRPQLEVGTTATEYEPYVEPVTTNIYLDEPLRRINGYSDYIDLSESRVVRKIAKTVLRNTEIIGEVKNKPYPYAFVVLGESGKATKYNELCTHFRAQRDFSFRVEGNNVFKVLNSESTNETRIAFRLYLNGQIISDVTEVKNYAEEQYNNGTPIIFYYAVADGLETKEIISLPDIPTFKGTTVIDSNAEVIPSNAEVEYLGKA